MGVSVISRGDLLEHNLDTQLQPLLAQMDQRYRTCGNYTFLFRYGTRSLRRHNP
jgi:hypothetical protein